MFDYETDNRKDIHRHQYAQQCHYRLLDVLCKSIV